MSFVPQFDWLINQKIPEMSEGNIIKLQKSYRHPFEFINPNLYRKDTEENVLDVSQLFMEDEREFETMLFKDTNSDISVLTP